MWMCIHVRNGLRAAVRNDFSWHGWLRKQTTEHLTQTNKSTLTTVTHKKKPGGKKKSNPAKDKDIKYNSVAPWYKYVSGRQINSLSPVCTLQHVEERKSHLNRALLGSTPVIFYHSDGTKESGRRGRKQKEDGWSACIYSHLRFEKVCLIRSYCCVFIFSWQQ